MEPELATTDWTGVEADWLILGVTEPPRLEGPLAAVDEGLGGAVGRLIEAGDLTGKSADLLPLRGLSGIGAPRVLLVGLGKPENLTAAGLDGALMSAARLVSDKQNLRVAVALPAVESLGAAVAAQTAAAALCVGSVGQDLYRSEPGRYPLASVRVLAEQESEDLQQAVRRGGLLGEAANLTRELVNRPAGEIFPASFADRAERLAQQHGLGCEVFDEGRLRQERMNAMLAVAAGSAQPPRMVVLEHRGGAADAPFLALVGKGVTFDSGGLSLKSSEGMSTMKADMAGAATVLGALTAVAQLALPVNVRGYMGLVENMPSGSSYKLGDVLKARNGVTIEVLNTDAEGRLVLADVLSYAVDQGAERIVDLATLTGGCVVALGEDVAGAFSNDQPWCDQVLAAAAQCGEQIWQMPMFPLYDELIKSDVADIKNTAGRWGSAITAAKFLQRFVGETPWVHLDIAGPSFASSNKPQREGGATGCLVRTLVQLATNVSQSGG